MWAADFDIDFELNERLVAGWILFDLGASGFTAVDHIELKAAAAIGEFIETQGFLEADYTVKQFGMTWIPDSHMFRVTVQVSVTWEKMRYQTELGTEIIWKQLAMYGAKKVDK